MTRPNPIGIISMFYARPFGRVHFDTFTRMKQAGCDFVELLVPEPGELDLRETRSVLADHGLGVVLAARVNLTRDLASDDPVAHQAGVTYLQSCAGIAQELGATIVGGPLYGAPLVFAGRPPTPVTEDHRKAKIDRIVAGLKTAGRTAADCGVVFGIEPLNRFETDIANTTRHGLDLAAAVDLPSVIYNSPYYGFETKADLFFDLRKRYPHLIGFKEFGGAASLRYAAEHITGHDASVTLMVGVDTQVFHGYVNCGAVGAITGIGNVLPKEVLHLVSLCEKAAAGDASARRQALELEQALAMLSSFDEGVDLVLFYKYLLVLEGHAEYNLHFNKTDQLTPSQQTYARDQLTLFKNWYQSWSA